MPIAVAIVPSMPARPAVGVYRDAFPGQHVVGHAHEAARAEHQPVVRPGRPPARPRRAGRGRASCARHRARPARRPGACADPVEASPSESGAGGVRSTSAPRSARPTRLLHTRSASPGRTDTAPTPRSSIRSRSSGSFVDSSATMSISRGATAAGSSRDGASGDRRPPRVRSARRASGSSEGVAVPVHDVAPVARTADDLRDERPAALLGEDHRVGTGIGARDHDGARPAFEHERRGGSAGSVRARRRRCRRGSRASPAENQSGIAPASGSRKGRLR